MKASIGVFCVLFSISSLCLAADPEIKSLPDGIALKVGMEQVELRVASPHAFRLHLAFPSSTLSSAPFPDATFPGAADSTPSIFLSTNSQPDTPFTVTRAGAVVGIKTGVGELRVDTDRKMWSLLDSNGAVLTDWGTLGQMSVGTTNQETNLLFSAGGTAGKANPVFYASGNIPKLGSLTQKEGDGRMGNGQVSLPQFWDDAGYGVLMTGQFDDQPGKWQRSNAGVNFVVPGVSVDLYLMPAATLYDWLRDYSELTGFAPVPPRWSLGYLQSRWGWKDKAYIDDAAARFRKDQLPVDAFIIDFEWYTKTPDYAVKMAGLPGFSDFDWNPALFPDPQTQLAGFAKQGLHIIGIRKPRLGNSDNLVLARKNGWVLPPVFSGTDTNINSRTLDFSKPDVRAWYAKNNLKFAEAGMPGFWNDEGEKLFSEYYYWNLAEVALFQQVDPDGRFWSLNRAFSPGLQRLGAAVWTGDIEAAWKQLAMQPGELLSYGLSGMPYTTCDIGGYSKTPSPELLARWMEAGVFFPIQRSHSEWNATPHFPWLFGPDAEHAIQKALDLRYQLIPYYYSLAFENNQDGAPLMRPLAMEFPNDKRAAHLTDQWLMGKGLMAAPLLNEGGSRKVYLPKDHWFVFGSSNMLKGRKTLRVTCKLDEIPMYVRAGTLLPLGPVVQSTGEATTAPLTLQIYPGRDATFAFVEDDGRTLNYTQGASRITRFSWDDRTKTLSWKVSGNYSGPNVFLTISAVLFAPGSPASQPGTLGRDGAIIFK